MHAYPPNYHPLVVLPRFRIYHLRRTGSFLVEDDPPQLLLLAALLAHGAEETGGAIIPQIKRGAVLGGDAVTEHEDANKNNKKTKTKNKNKQKQNKKHHTDAARD